MTDLQRDDVEVAAARAALLALGATIEHRNGAPIQHCIVLPDPMPLPIAAAVEALARMPKPITCVAYSAMGVMVVGAWPVPKNRVVAVQQRRNDLDWLREHYGDDTGVRLLVRGDGDEVLLTSAAVAEWYISYDLLFASSVTNKPDAAARALGAHAVTVFLAPTGGGMSGRPTSAC